MPKVRNEVLELYDFIEAKDRYGDLYTTSPMRFVVL